MFYLQRKLVKALKKYCKNNKNKKEFLISA